MPHRSSAQAAQRKIDLHSGDRWQLRCRVERIGDDLVCRLSGGSSHIGAVALAQWRDGRASSECLVVDRHREKELAIHTAHRLCKAARHAALCIAGIHFDDLSAKQVREVSRVADRLSKEAARLVEEQRQRVSADASSILARIESGSDEVEKQFEHFLELPLENCVPSVGQASGVELFAPLYLSNACMNDCAYCGFRHSEHFVRTTLDRPEALAECRGLVLAGHRSIELVTGEVPTDAFVGYIADLCVNLLHREPGLNIGLNVGSLRAAQYRRLREAGAVDARIYQETYDTDSYFDVHRGGPKREMTERLEAPYHAASEGFPTVGLGILLGLAPLARDLARLVRHAEVLKEDHPQLQLDFSLPRIRPLENASGFRPPFTIDDEAFTKAFLFLRHRFPDAELTLSTRESPELRDSLLALCISRMSAGVSTAPGGYSEECVKGIEQFKITDVRSYETVASSVRQAGREIR